MNKNSDVTPDSAAGPMEDDKRWQLVQCILRSPDFLKAPRMCALLSFLVEKVLSGMAATIDEHSIGVEVFRRNPRDFDTTSDPIVRVQMGRLRGRLARFDAAGNAAPMRVIIPQGKYVPEFMPAPVSRHIGPVIRMAPLRSLTPDSGAAMFVSGLEEELAQRLFQRFGDPGSSGTKREYRVQVSVRVEQQHARASIRLTDTCNDQIVWLHQRDCHGTLGIARQETLALAICDDLSGFLACDARSPAGGLPGRAGTSRAH